MPDDLKAIQIKVRQGTFWKVPPEASNCDGDKICYALNRLAEEYPMMPIPYATLYAIVSGIKAIPSYRNKKVQALLKSTYHLNDKMMGEHKRTIIRPRGEGSVRASIDQADMFTNTVYPKQVRATRSAARMDRMAELLGDISQLGASEVNPTQKDWYTRVRSSMKKALPAERILAALPPSTRKR